MDIYVKMTLKL